MDMVATLGLVAPAAVRGVAVAAEHRLAELANGVARRRLDLGSAGERWAGTSGTSWESPAAELFRTKVRRETARVLTAEEALTRAEHHLRRAGAEIRRKLEDLAGELDVLEHRVTESVARVALRAETGIHEAVEAVARGTLGIQSSEELRSARGAYANVVNDSIYRAAVEAIGGVRPGGPR
ncbi:MAG: hypothetical protein L0G59_04660 [Kocuria sp.]|nr:hypothetical protein [Kocuria sp.]